MTAQMTAQMTAGRMSTAQMTTAQRTAQAPNGQAVVRLMEPVVRPFRINVTRLVVLIAVVVFALSLIFVAGAQAGSQLRETSVHIVGAGETLWDIAAEHTAPGGDVRATLYDIGQMNDLSGSVLGIDQSLIVPGGH